MRRTKDGLATARGSHAQRKAATRARVAEALRVIEKENLRLSITLVAKVAGVSRPTIYNSSELRGMVEGRIAKQRVAQRRIGSKVRDDARTIANLKRENERLRAKLEGRS